MKKITKYTKYLILIAEINSQKNLSKRYID